VTISQLDVLPTQGLFSVVRVKNKTPMISMYETVTYAVVTFDPVENDTMGPLSTLRTDPGSCFNAENLPCQHYNIMIHEHFT